MIFYGAKIVTLSKIYIYSPIFRAKRLSCHARFSVEVRCRGCRLDGLEIDTTDITLCILCPKFAHRNICILKVLHNVDRQDISTRGFVSYGQSLRVSMTYRLAHSKRAVHHGSSNWIYQVSPKGRYMPFSIAPHYPSLCSMELLQPQHRATKICYHHHERTECPKSLHRQ